MKAKKQNKILYYLKNYFKCYLPNISLEQRKKKLLVQLTEKQLLEVEERVDYYCKIQDKFSPSGKFQIKDLKKPKTPKAYYFDTYEYARFFNKNTPINFVFGDLIEVPDVPSIVKSRPINGNNENSILLNLDKVRHFVWVKNDKPFNEKKNLLIGRAAVHQQHRIDFYEKYFHHPLCNLGQVNKNGGNPNWIKPKISINEHLDYKFILSLEGNDVATNLKWIMSSNSIAVTPKLKYETWFMEGKLEGGKHFIEIKEDYSDLEEKLNYYIAHPEECLEIIKNANEYCRQFFNKNVEDYCGLRVLEGYLK